MYIFPLWSARAQQEPVDRVPDKVIFILNREAMHIESSFLIRQANILGEFTGLICLAIVICINGERLIEVTALSRGAMRKQQECAFREHQQQARFT